MSIKKKSDTDKETKSVITNGKRKNLRGKIGVWDKDIQIGGRSKDGGGIGRGDHFLPYKFM